MAKPEKTKARRAVKNGKQERVKMVRLISGDDIRKFTFGSACKYVKRDLDRSGALEGLTKRQVFDKVVQRYEVDFTFEDLSQFELKFLRPVYTESRQSGSRRP